MNTTRRTFLKTTAAAALGFPAILRAANPNSNLQVAGVGCHGKGFGDLSKMGAHARVKFTGFCDVDTARFDKIDAAFPGVPHFQDYRAMLAKLGDTVDAVTVSTPDHMHAAISLAAMRRGKAVYCQKPLARTVWEARQMRLQAAKSGVVTQMGNQIHSASEYRTAVKLIREGAIGKISAVHSWHPSPGNKHTGLTAPPASGPVPATLDWDAWLGVAPLRDFAPDAYHPFKWRDWQDFGLGTMGDFGCHILDPVFSALDLTAPLTVRAENDGLNAHTWPSAETVSYIFPATAFTTGKTLPLTWYDGGRMPALALARMPAGTALPGGGSLFIGEGGTMVLAHYKQPELYPQEKFASLQIEKVPAGDHYHAWVDAALGGAKTTDHFDYAGPLTETVVLGNVATQMPGTTLEWDAAGMRFPNTPEADRLLTRVYRKGWEVTADDTGAGRGGGR